MIEAINQSAESDTRTCLIKFLHVLFHWVARQEGKRRVEEPFDGIINGRQRMKIKSKYWQFIDGLENSLLNSNDSSRRGCRRCSSTRRQNRLQIDWVWSPARGIIAGSLIDIAWQPDHLLRSLQPISLRTQTIGLCGGSVVVVSLMDQRWEGSLLLLLLHNV